MTSSSVKDDEHGIIVLTTLMYDCPFKGLLVWCESAAVRCDTDMLKLPGQEAAASYDTHS